MCFGEVSQIPSICGARPSHYTRTGRQAGDTKCHVWGEKNHPWHLFGEVQKVGHLTAMPGISCQYHLTSEEMKYSHASTMSKSEEDVTSYITGVAGKNACWCELKPMESFEILPLPAHTINLTRYFKKLSPSICITSVHNVNSTQAWKLQ